MFASLFASVFFVWNTKTLWTLVEPHVRTSETEWNPTNRSIFRRISVGNEILERRGINAIMLESASSFNGARSTVDDDYIPDFETYLLAVPQPWLQLSTKSSAITIVPGLAVERLDCLPGKAILHSKESVHSPSVTPAVRFLRALPQDKGLHILTEYIYSSRFSSPSSRWNFVPHDSTNKITSLVHLKNPRWLARNPPLDCTFPKDFLIYRDERDNC